MDIDERSNESCRSGGVSRFRDRRDVTVSKAPRVHNLFPARHNHSHSPEPNSFASISPEIATRCCSGGAWAPGSARRSPSIGRGIGHSLGDICNQFTGTAERHHTTHRAEHLRGYGQHPPSDVGNQPRNRVDEHDHRFDPRLQQQLVGDELDHLHRIPGQYQRWPRERRHHDLGDERDSENLAHRDGRTGRLLLPRLEPALLQVRCKRGDFVDRSGGRSSCHELQRTTRLPCDDSGHDRQQLRLDSYRERDQRLVRCACLCEQCERWNPGSRNRVG